MRYLDSAKLLAIALAATFALACAGNLWAETGATATGASRAMNPAISVNGLFLGTWQERTPEGQKNVSASLQELEIAWMSMVDPYFKANVFMAIEPPHEHAEEHAEGEVEEEHEHDLQLALEEAFVRALSLPSGLGARAGKMLVPFGRANQIHTHHLPFIQEQNGFGTVVGPHGVSDVGVEVSYAPLTPWYLNLVFFAGDGSTSLFDAENREFAYAGRVENLWDLGEAATFEVGGSALTGPGLEDTRHNLYGADARIKWSDPRKTYGRAFEWLTELIVDSPDEGDEHTVLDSRVRYRFARCWWAGFGHSFLRTEQTADEEESGSEDAHELRGQIAFAPSEFSMIRLDGSYLDKADEGGVFKVEIQLNFTIGSHPAHLY